MARGDVKSGGYGRGGGGGGSDYDDEGRGLSKSIYDAFERLYIESNYSLDWLLNIQIFGSSWNTVTLRSLIHNTTYRYNLYDGLRKEKDFDSRVRRLVEKHGGKSDWETFHADAWKRYNDWKEEQEKIQKREQREYEERRKIEREQAARDAERIRIEEHEEMSQIVENITGAIHSDLYEVMLRRDVIGLQEGDWIDDIVPAYMGLGGFAEEEHHYASGNINLQVTVSLDCSNSMVYNDICREALEVFVQTGLSLKQLKEEYPNDVTIAFFEFSKNSDGKGTRRLGAGFYGEFQDYSERDELDWHEFESYRKELRSNDRWYNTSFTGQDTWMDPLFQSIKKWEDKWSNPGAVRLDIIITDAVLEHPTDIRLASETQSRRNGNLQTVLLNLLPETEWVNSTLPYKCVQYGVDKEVLGNVLRTLLSEFLSLYI